MVTIKKSSLAGRYFSWLMDKFSGRRDPWSNLSLCYFVQNIFWRTVGLVMVGMLGLLVVGFLLAIFVSPCLYFFGVIGFGVTVIYAILFWCIFLVVVVTKAWEEYRAEVRRAEWRNESPAPKQPSVVLEWLKAKKQKICPRVNVIE